MYSYIIEKGKEGDFARARLEGVDASFKDLAQVCGNIRRRPVDQAIKFLEEASEGKRPVLYRSSNRHLGHRRELGGKKGRYPKKSARIVLGVLRSALANAQHKGLSEELIVTHACANKVSTYMRYSSKGRRNPSALETARVEIILKEREGAKRPARKAQAEAQKAPSKAEKKEAPKDAVKKEEASKQERAAKAEIRADDAQLEEKREDKAHAKGKDDKNLPGRKPPQKVK